VHCYLFHACYMLNLTHLSFFHYPITSRSLEAFCISISAESHLLRCAERCIANSSTDDGLLVGRMFLLKVKIPDAGRRFDCYYTSIILGMRVFTVFCLPRCIICVSFMIGCAPNLLLGTVEENIHLGTGSSAEQICKRRKGDREWNINIKERK